jgi:alpha-tubulin suppressor-like RCC1 family protein
MPIWAPTLAAPGNDWKYAVAGGVHCLAIKSEGTLWTWGHNWAGSLGIDSTKGSTLPLQVGSSTNWVKVWAGILESVGLQSDGSLWYWGDNPDPSFPQAKGIFTPTRVTPDTNWVDAGIGVNTMFAIKSDGTLWVWGRQAHVYTGATNQAQDAIPTRPGTNSDWQSIPSCGNWWCQGLIKKDGSLWLMDASRGLANGPGPGSPYNPVKFRRIEFEKDYAAFTAGAVHAAAPGVHGPIGVAITPDGEVWTWGVVLGDPPSLKGFPGALLARFIRVLNPKAPPFDSPPVFRNTPWQLRNIPSDNSP